MFSDPSQKNIPLGLCTFNSDLSSCQKYEPDNCYSLSEVILSLQVFSLPCFTSSNGKLWIWGFFSKSSNIYFFQTQNLKLFYLLSVVHFLSPVHHNECLRVSSIEFRVSSSLLDIQILVPFYILMTSHNAVVTNNFFELMHNCSFWTGLSQPCSV